MSNGQYICFLDLGTQQMRMLVATREAPHRIVAHHVLTSEGISHGAIIDLDSASDALRRLLEIVQQSVDQKITKVYCTISGEGVSAVNSHSIVKIRSQEVTPYDVESLVNTAQAISLDNKEVLHVLPMRFKVDNQSGIADPIGMYGVRLEGDFHIITVDQGIYQNFIRCLQRVGLSLAAFVFSPIGLGAVALSQDEKQQGVVLIDVGSGTTDYSVYINGALVKSGSLPIGGSAITRDIAYRLKISNSLSEQLKILMCGKENIDLEQQLQGGATCAELLEVIEARYTQILKMVDRQIIEAGLKHKVGRGYVLAGAASNYKGLKDLIQAQLLIESRQANFMHSDIQSLPTSWLSVVGVLCFSKQYEAKSIFSSVTKSSRFSKLFHWLEAHL
ncbi:cell division protein FtsA [Gammaproteobacteria bacterium]|nr:cell division protein FtsA [Gammaproteobacteria bacterium]